MIRDRLFKQVVIMEVSQHVYVQIVEKKNRLVNLDIEIWEMDRLETNLGVKNVDKSFTS